MDIKRRDAGKVSEVRDTCERDPAGQFCEERKSIVQGFFKVIREIETSVS